MKISTKAVLLSCFVFPGLGHLYLKRFRLGLLLALGALVAVSFMVSSTLNTALEVADKIQNSGIPLDANAISSLVEQQSSATEESTNTEMYSLVALWLIGIFDSYRIGRTLEKARGVAGENETDGSL